MRDPRRVDFVEFTGFLDGALDMGLSFDDGVKELLDNAVDSGARTINVRLVKLGEDRIRVVVMDDGPGIPLVFEDESGEQKYGIPYVMAFGNSEDPLPEVIADGTRQLIGKFGFGLSKTITCLAQKEGRAEVWTKRVDDEEWRMCYYDYEELVESGGILPAETTQPMPPVIPESDHGTVVVIDIQDPEVSRVGSIQTRLLTYVGRMYRKFIADGLRIRITSEPRPGALNTKTATISDPLCLMEGSVEVGKFGRAASYEPITIAFDGENGFPAYTDPSTGRASEIRITISRLRKHVVDDALMGEVAGKTARQRDLEYARWGIGIKGQGFYLLREGREILSASTLGVYQKHSQYNYMHGEVEFDSGLDDLFRVRTNKSRLTVTPILSSLLEDAVGETVAKVRKDHREDSFDQIKQFKDIDIETQAESLARQASHLLPSPPITEQERERSSEHRRYEMERAIEETTEKIDIEINAILYRQTRANAEDDDATYDWAGGLARSLMEDRERLIERIRRRFETRAPARIFRGEEIEDGLAYDVEDRGDEARISVSTRAEFGRGVYDKISDDESLRTVVDLMLMSMGYTEFVDCKQLAENIESWHQVRREISTHLNEFSRKLAGGDA